MFSLTHLISVETEKKIFLLVDEIKSSNMSISVVNWLFRIGSISRVYACHTKDNSWDMSQNMGLGEGTWVYSYPYLSHPDVRVGVYRETRSCWSMNLRDYLDPDTFIVKYLDIQLKTICLGA